MFFFMVIVLFCHVGEIFMSPILEVLFLIDFSEGEVYPFGVFW